MCSGIILVYVPFGRTQVHLFGTRVCVVKCTYSFTLRTKNRGGKCTKINGKNALNIPSFSMLTLLLLSCLVIDWFPIKKCDKWKPHTWLHTQLTQMMEPHSRLFKYVCEPLSNKADPTRRKPNRNTCVDLWRCKPPLSQATLGDGIVR